MSVLLRVEGRGGHASTPARMGPTARLARAITRLDRSPMPRQPPGADRRAVPAAGAARAARAPAADGERRPARPGAGAGARPPLGPESRRDGADDVRGHHPVRAARPSTSSPRPPPPASTSGSCSATPSETVLAHVRKAIGDDQVEIDVVEAYEPSPLSPYSTADARTTRSS